MMVNPLTKALGIGRRPNSNQQTSDIELGNVTVQSTGHQKVMVLNDDVLNADVKEQFQAQSKVLSKLSLGDVSKRLLKRLSDAIAESSTSVPANLTESYTQARLLAMSLAKVSYTMWPCIVLIMVLVIFHRCTMTRMTKIPNTHRCL